MFVIFCDFDKFYEHIYISSLPYTITVPNYVLFKIAIKLFMTRNFNEIINLMLLDQRGAISHTPLYNIFIYDLFDLVTFPKTSLL